MWNYKEECTTFAISNGQGNIKETTLHVSFVDDAYLRSELSVLFAHAKNIRTFLSISKSKEESFCDVITSNCKVLRCLTLKRSSVKLVSNSIGKLKHLRYLVLSSNSYLKSLPNSFTNLVNLQTLKLNYCSNLKELPRDFEKLINLRHLELPSCNTLNSLPSGLGQLTQLRYLNLSKNESLLSLPDSMNDLLNLQTLTLNQCSKLKELPRDIGKLINLRHLKISDCDKLEYMPSGLGKLTNLQISNYVLMKSEKCIPRHGGELKELMRLNNLRGKLELTNLSCEKNVAVEYEKAKLKDKQYLRSLRLKWDSEAKMDETEAIVGYEMSLEGLQPHQNIQSLRLTNYGSVKLSSWPSSLTKLVKLTLKDCAKCEHLVPSNQFNCLKHLKLVRLICLEYISNTNNVSEDLVGSTTTLLPSLESLVLWDLPNLKGWLREIEVDHSCFDANANANDDNHTSLPYYLPSLSELIIDDCPKLTCMPLYPHLEGDLMLRKTSWKPLEETLRMRMMMSNNFGSVFPTTLSFSVLSKLERLTLTDIDDLECLPDFFKSFTSLNYLYIDGCPKLKDLCPGILHLSSLRSLCIVECEGLGDMLISDDYDFMCQSLNGTLQSLPLYKLPNIVSVLPKGIQHLTSLHDLDVLCCDSLTTIPEWIHNLKSSFLVLSKLVSARAGWVRVDFKYSVSHSHSQAQLKKKR